MKLLFTLLILFFVSALSAQYSVSGKVIDATSGDPLVYANVVDVANQYRGTLTNLDGSFSLNLDDEGTELVFSYLGYQDLRIKARQLVNDPIIRLKSESITLTQIEVMASNDALYEAVINARKNLAKAGTHQGRIFFQLTTTEQDEPIEILQNYYNGETANGSIKQLTLKNGRIAVTGNEALAFSNLGTSRAFTMLDLLKDGPFPSQPLELGAAALRKEYELRLRPDFSNSNLLHFNFEPSSTSKALFEGEMWVGKTDNFLKKLILRKQSLSEHPFKTLRQSDQIRSVDLEVGYTFREIDGRSVINYIQLDYRMELVENVGTATAKVRSLACQGIMQFYAPNQLFFLSLPLPLKDRNDYTAVHDLAYDPEFWVQNKGLVFTEKQLEQQAYLQKTGLLINYPIGPENKEHNNRYLRWTGGKRITANNTMLITEPEDLLNIHKNAVAKLFVHVDNVGDKPSPRSVVLLDRYALDTATPKSNRYFEVLNLYCDLAEISRLKLDAKVAKKPRDYDKLTQLYYAETFRLKRVHEAFIHDMAKDDDEQSKLKKWSVKTAKELAQLMNERK